MTVARNTDHNGERRKANRKLGLREAAELLGVTAGHLSRVLRGLRSSKSLLKRYATLTRSTLGEKP